MASSTWETKILPSPMAPVRHGLDQGANDFLLAGRGHHHFELEFVQEIHVVLAAAVDLLVALLAAMAAPPR